MASALQTWGDELSLNAPYGAPYFLTPRLSMVRVFSSPCLNAPYGAPCFLTLKCRLSTSSTPTCLNAPYGTPCFLTARRVAPAVTRGNDTSDRRGPKKHESTRKHSVRLAAFSLQYGASPPTANNTRPAPETHANTGVSRHSTHAPPHTPSSRLTAPSPHAAHTPDPTHRGRGQPRSTAQLAPAS